MTRKIGKVPELAAPFVSADVQPQGDIYAEIAKACGLDMGEALRPVAVLPENEKPKIIGVDMASGPDQSSQALAVRGGTHVVLITGEHTSVDREWISGKNASHKADRECLAMAFTMLAEARGAKVERKDSEANPGYCGQGIDLRISNMGVGCMVDINNLHGGTYTLIHWYNTEYPTSNFTTRFCTCVGSSNDRRPHHKATSFPNDWYSLAMFLDGGLLLASRGEAFD